MVLLIKDILGISTSEFDSIITVTCCVLIIYGTSYVFNLITIPVRIIMGVKND